MIKPIVAVLSFALAAAGMALPEEKIVHAGTTYRVVRISPADLDLVWKGADGEPYATFSAVQAALAKRGERAAFLMNAGIYEPGLVPSGLHVEGGREIRPLNTGKGEGNFFLKPNGVFAVSMDGRAMVIPASDYIASDAPPRIALQSGPLLLAGGRRHPAFREASTSIKHRNGVGVDRRGRVVFAMTDRRQETNFWNFAGLFLKLDCPNALFLDGDISAMAVDPDAPVQSNRFAAILVVGRPTESELGSEDE